MPSKSPEQKKFMQAVANNPKFAKKVGVPQSVGKDFSTADKNRKNSKGGDTMANTSRMNRLEELGRVNAEKASTAKGKRNLTAEKKRVVKELKMAKGGMTLSEHASMPASKAHKGLKMGGMTGYASGGMPMVMKDGKKVPSFAADGKGKMKMGGSVAPSKMGKVKTSSGMDGVAERGLTKARKPVMKTMARGGKTC